nr:hypothetical protein [Conexibacter woesei]
MYLPVSTPSASGDHTTCEMPFSSHNGKTSRSGPRHSALYCGCEDTNLTAPSTSRPAWICSGSHSEKPIARALPERTTSLSASIVSSIATLGSGRWHWYRST